MDGHLKAMEHLLDGKMIYSTVTMNYVYTFIPYSSADGLGYNSSIIDMDRFIAPANFTGDLTGSYSLQLLVQLQLSQNTSINVDMAMVEICGPGGIECLVGRFEVNSSQLQSDRIILLSVSNLLLIQVANIKCCYR